MVHSSAGEARRPSDELNLVLYVTGLPLTATEESIVAMFPGRVFYLLCLFSM